VCDGFGECSTALPCDNPNDCDEGAFCVDNVCCNAACGDPCDSCTVAGSVGECTVSAVGHLGDPSCAPYLCAGTSACGSECSGDEACVTSAHCTPEGSCVYDVPLGGSCGTDLECGSGHCVDGLCCDTACPEACASCDIAGSEGTCLPSPQGSAGDPACAPYACDGESSRCPTSCTTNAQCPPGSVCDSGVDACLPPAALCDGEHHVALPSGDLLDCTPYRCNDDGECLGLCASTADCASGFVCSTGSCAAPEEDGCDCRAAPGSRSSSNETHGLILIVCAVWAARRARRRQPESERNQAVASGR
jgi:hypothetical protein